MKNLFILLLISKIILCASACEEGVNNCTSCNPITKLCVRCDKDVLIPDQNGGCTNSKNVY